jgi:hypothetical protein
LTAEIRTAEPWDPTHVVVGLVVVALIALVWWALSVRRRR